MLIRIREGNCGGKRIFRTGCESWSGGAQRVGNHGEWGTIGIRGPWEWSTESEVPQGVGEAQGLESTEGEGPRGVEEHREWMSTRSGKSIRTGKHREWGTIEVGHLWELTSRWRTVKILLTATSIHTL